MQGIHERLHGGAVEDDHILNGLLLLAEDVDDVLRQLAAQNGCDGGNLAAYILQEAAEEFWLEGFAGEAQGLVLLRGNLGEQLKIFAIARDAAALDLHELPQGAQTGQRRGNALQAALGLCVLFRQAGNVAGEEPGRVELSLGDGFDDLGAILLSLDVDDGARPRLLLELGGDVSLIALNDVVVLYQIAEDETVHAMSARRVKGLAVDARRRVDEVERIRIQIRGNNDVKIGEIARALGLDSLRVDNDLDARVQLAQGYARGLGAILANGGFHLGEEELRAQVGLGDDSAVEDGERADAGEDEVLCDLVGQGSDGDEENVCVLDLGLGGHAPEADLAIIEGDFI